MTKILLGRTGTAQSLNCMPWYKVKYAVNQYRNVPKQIRTGSSVAGLTVAELEVIFISDYL